MPTKAVDVLDVLIVGAGPAGAACAILLSRAGLRVGLAGRRPARSGRRPTEVLSPATLRQIRAIGLPVPTMVQRAQSCRGVLSVWSDPSEQFFDYGLYACGEALMVDRAAYDTVLVDAAQSSGVVVVPADGSAAIERQMSEWRLSDGDVQVRARFLVDATGRSGGVASRATAPRRFHDRLVSFTTFHPDSNGDDDLLLLEAVSDGWWYVSRDATGVSSIVYLSDADLLPRSAPARVEHLERAYRRTTLVRERLRGVPSFAEHRVSDARTGERTAIAGQGWLAIGDAAGSIDPLSGEGLRLALASAERAATTITALQGDGGARGLDAFASWYRRELAEQRQRGCDAYRSVAPDLGREPFWQRRSSVSVVESVAG